MRNEHWGGRRVLITGANGFIGAWLANALVDRGAEVTAYDRSGSGALDLHSGLKRRLDLVLGDLSDADRLRSTLTGREIQTVYHLGAQSSISIATGSPVSAFESNIQGTWTLLDACHGAATVETIVVASSLTVYGEQERSPIDESFALNGNQPYASSKACADILARCFAATWRMPLAVARTCNVFGTMDPHLDHIVPGTILSALHGERPEIRSDGSPTKGYLYVHDVVSAYLLLGERAADESVRGRAFNFQSDEPTSVIDLVRQILTLAGRSDLEPRITGAPGAYEHVHLSNKRARSVLGWAPRYSLAEGLRETIEWFRASAGADLERAAKHLHVPR